MTLIIDERPTRFSWATVINLTEFPELLLRFQRNVPGRPNAPTTVDIEKQGELLAQHDFSDRELEEFIRKVCSWGGYPGVAQRIINKNPSELLTSSFRAAHAAAHGGRVVAALEDLLQVNQLAVSFASKSPTQNFVKDCRAFAA